MSSMQWDFTVPVRSTATLHALDSARRNPGEPFRNPLRTTAVTKYSSVSSANGERFKDIHPTVKASSYPYLYTLTYSYKQPVDNMAMLTSRINLLPTSRALASGVPLAPKIAFVLPSQSHDGHHGRADPPAKFVGRNNGVVSMNRINGKCGPGTRNIE
jgi:hypothetical protein